MYIAAELFGVLFFVFCFKKMLEKQRICDIMRVYSQLTQNQSPIGLEVYIFYRLRLMSKFMTSVFFYIYTKSSGRNII